MPDLRPGPLELTLKLAARLRARSPWEVARLGLARLGDTVASEDRLIMLVRDAGGSEPGQTRPGLILRRAAPHDAAPYARWIGTDSAATFRRRLTERTRCYLIAEGDRILHASWVTTAAAWTRELRTYLCPPAGDAYVYESFTRADARGLGLYPFALRGICSELGDEGLGRVWVAVEADNPGSLKAVGKAGFGVAFELAYRRRWGTLSLDAPSGPLAGVASGFIGCGGSPPGGRAGASVFKRCEQ